MRKGHLKIALHLEGEGTQRDEVTFNEDHRPGVSNSNGLGGRLRLETRVPRAALKKWKKLTLKFHVNIEKGGKMSLN